MPPKGYKCSEETKQKISKASLGRPKPPLTEEHKNKIRIARLGKKHSIESKRKLSNTLKKIGAGKWNKGKVHSKEHLAKMSKALKGRKFTEEHKRKISQANKGKKLPSMIGNTNGFKKGMTPWNKGIKYPQISGENHHAWKGGIMPLEIAIRNSFENKQWKKAVFSRDNYTCQECFLRGGELHAHHDKKPFVEIFNEFLKLYNQFSPIEDKETLLRLAIRYEPFWDVTNGITLCKECHKLTKNYGE